MGVGLAVAILLDATIVRAVLLPATMKLLGEWNWYLPHSLLLPLCRAATSRGVPLSVHLSRAAARPRHLKRCPLVAKQRSGGAAPFRCTQALRQ
jgi:hypothetical protein